MITCNLADVITDALASPVFGMSPDVANLLAVQILRAAAERGHAGTDYYLPYLHNLSRAERNEKIRREFRGNNLQEICKKYGVSQRTVYRACRQFQ
ncbi:MAG: Mor transcription activator family protein [Azonexus sp.]|jgi:Mor family transcriptional regulator|nr:Mor transcription activator family protein [Azonexus sp.]